MIDSNGRPGDASEVLSHRLFWPATILLTLVGLALRLYGLGELELTQWDEGPYVGYMMDKGPCVREDPLIVYAPPLFPWLCGVGLALFGGEPRIGIGVAGLLGALCVLLGALMARRWFGPLAGLLTALFIAFDPLHIAYSRMALTETAFTAGALLTLWLGARALETKQIRDAILFGAAAGLSTLAKFHGVLPMITAGAGVLIELAIGGGPLFASRSACFRSRFRTLLVASLAAIPFLCVVAWFIHSSLGFEAFAESRKTWVEGIHPHTILGSARFITWTTLLFGSVGIVSLGAVGSLLAFRFLPRADRSSTLLYPLFLLVILISYRNYTRLVVPFFTLLTPLAALATVTLATKLTHGTLRESRRVLVAIAIGLVAIATGAPHATNAIEFHSDAYAEMATRVVDQLHEEPGTMVVVAQQSIFPYLTDDTLPMVWSVTEPTAWKHLDEGSLRYLLTDQDPARHHRVSPYFSAIEPRMELLTTIRNRLALPLLFDRLGEARYFAFQDDPTAPEFAIESELRLYRVRPP